MSAIEQALTRLNSAIGTLENSINDNEKGLSGKQHEMFADLTNKKEVVSKKVNSMISQIESVLEDA